MIVASIDIGTNTVLLLIARVMDDLTLIPVANEYRIPRIGKGLVDGGIISDEKVNSLFDILEQYSGIIREHNCDTVYVIATNALRIARNGEKIAERIRNRYGWDTRIVTGDEEAGLSFIGATGGFGDSKMLVIDIGGGSTELSFGIHGKLKFRKSFPVGVVSASEKFFRNDPANEAEINVFREKLKEIFGNAQDLKYAPDHAVALAGTPTTLACMLKNLPAFDEDKVEGSILTKENIKLMIEKLSGMNSAEILMKYKTVVNGREDLILSGAVILYYIMGLLDLNEVIVSTKGIRYGAIIRNLRLR